MQISTVLPILVSLALAAPSPDPPPKPLPLLIWHGLGDRFDADGLQTTGDLAQKVYPGTFVYYIRTDEDGGNDRTNTFFGNLTTQINEVCEAIRQEPHLAGSRVDALGFSQGGQFLRGLIERCDGLEVRSLVTFGSQHNGIAEFQKCGPLDFLCKGATALVKGNAWTDYVQNKVVPAQYYRTVNETTGLPSDEYLAYSNFLADVNNERTHKNKTYASRIAALEKFVMIVFEEDKTVIPKETGWFAEVNATSGDVTPLRERKLYKEDWLGLKKLDEKDGLVFRNTSGGHMQLDDKVLKATFKEYFGPERDGKTMLRTNIDEAVDSVMEKQEVFEKVLLSPEQQQAIERMRAKKGDSWCASDKAQASWDSLTLWEKYGAHWKAVTLPWLRGEVVRTSGVTDDEYRESL